MLQPDFNRLRETLLRGGIAPKHVRRYIAELRDHADDLIGDGISRSESRADAERAAWAQLGSFDDLASSMLARTELKSLGAQYPARFYGAGPAVALLMSYGIALLILMACILVLNMTIGKAEIISNQVLHDLGDAYCWFVRHALPIVIGLGFAASAIRQRANLGWLIIGTILISLIGASADMSIVTPPDLGSPGELQFGFGVASPPFPDLGPTLQRGLMNLAIVTPALAWLWFVRRRNGIALKSPR